MSSVFLERPDEWMAENAYAVLLPSYYEASPGHSLVVPKRVVPSIFDLTGEETTDLWIMIKLGVEMLKEKHKPDGFNVGVNCGEAAGQTVMHAHVHIIPRYVGDVPDPRGGVRLCVPDKGNYLASPEGKTKLTKGQLADTLSRHEMEVVQGGEWRPVAEHVLELIKIGLL